MKLHVLRYGAAIVLALYCGACQGESAASESEDVTAGCERYASLVCEPMSACWPSHFFVWYGDLATCVRQEARECEQIVTAPGSKTTHRDLISCAPSRACPESSTPCELPRGALAPDDACLQDVQCASGLCGANAYSPCGACRARLDEGGACSDTRDCEDDLYCSAGACVPMLPLGAACTNRDWCAVGLQCTDGICRAKPQPGDPCVDPSSCNGPCVEGTCRSWEEGISKEDYAAVGEACGGKCLAGSCDSCGSCEPPRPGHCVALPQVGERCLDRINDDTDRLEPVCMPPAVCSEGYCVLPNDVVCE